MVWDEGFEFIYFLALEFKFGVFINFVSFVNGGYSEI